MVKRYIFDRKKEAFVPMKLGVKGVLWTGLRYLLACAFAGVLFYVVFALAFSTDREKLLEKENSLLAAERDSLSEALSLVEGTVGNLRVRDREIYNNIFSADPPNYIVEARDTLLPENAELVQQDESDLVWDAYAVTSRAESRAQQVSEWISGIEAAFAADGFTPASIPSIAPVRNFSPIQTGASVGKKVNPFYKNVREHTGLDLVAPAGTDVLCSADGKVVKVTKSEKGMGNTVTVEHAGGFRTFYAHLGKVSVSEGQTVRQGRVLGEVGQSGSTFAPCLHYEVLRDGIRQDPVNFFFADLDPATYRDMMIVALTTGQSMD
jgi:murein DD-endopeptidase MepM/ murein hydrolase activator NlpD